MTDIDRSASVARIVLEHPEAARVFQRHGIDYCCHGDATLAEACRQASLDPDAVLRELAAALAAGDGPADGDPRALSTAALIARIVDRHHGYLRRALPHIAPIMTKVAKVHGARNDDLGPLAAAFRALVENLVPHLAEEERVLFPSLAAARPLSEAVKGELARMHEDHLAVGELLARMRTLTHGYTTPEWGCTTYRVLMSELEALEADILRHVHLENHVLAPRFQPAAATSGMSGAWR